MHATGRTGADTPALQSEISLIIHRKMPTVLFLAAFSFYSGNNPAGISNSLIAPAVGVSETELDFLTILLRYVIHWRKRLNPSNCDSGLDTTNVKFFRSCERKKI
jgi:hypothetical protein